MFDLRILDAGDRVSPGRWPRPGARSPPRCRVRSARALCRRPGRVPASVPGRAHGPAGVARAALSPGKTIIPTATVATAPGAANRSTIHPRKAPACPVNGGPCVMPATNKARPLTAEVHEKLGKLLPRLATSFDGERISRRARDRTHAEGGRPRLARFTGAFATPARRHHRPPPRSPNHDEERATASRTELRTWSRRCVERRRFIADRKISSTA